MKHFIRNLFLTALIFTVAIGTACSGDPIGDKSGTKTSKGGDISLTGSGASFPKPIYEKWVNEYQKINPTIKIDYQAKGSGGGQKDIAAELVAFGASDDPMKDEDMAKAKGGDLLHIPTVLGAVVLTYNLKDMDKDKPLKLSPEMISAIYMGKIKKWNDPKLAADNPDVTFPDADIIPVYRADSSGTTAVFTDFLSKTNNDFKETVTASKQPNWVKDVGIGANKNDGVMGQVKNTPNTIGYVEVAFAKENKLPVALVKNKAGNFVEPSVANISAAAAGSVKDMPNDMRIKIANADGDQTYPIASYTYILVYKNQKDAVKGKALVDFLWWATHDGEKFAEPLHYAPLPKEVVEKVEAKLSTITSDGKPLREVGKAEAKKAGE